MKILLVNHFPLEGSGSGTYTKNLAQHLAKRGNEVHVVLPENEAPDPVPGVVLHPVYFIDAEGKAPAPDALPFNFPCFTTHPRSLNTFGGLSDAERALYLGAFERAIDAVVEEVAPDIIHAQHVWLLADVACRTGLPCVLTAHGTDMMGYRLWPQLRPIADDAVRRCATIIAISRDNLADTIETIPAAEPKMTLMLNGYNEDVFYPQPVDRDAVMARWGMTLEPQDEVVLFAGKLTGFKGVDTLLRAAARYEAARPGIVTLIAGDGEEREALKGLAKELGLERTRFIGHQSQDELRELYNMADLFAMPSRREPFGLVALEALGCGLPVVATNQGGLPEFVTEGRGELVDVDDAEGLARAILHQLDTSKDAPERHAALAAEVRERFAQSRFAARLEGLYQHIIDEQAAVADAGAGQHPPSDA